MTEAALPSDIITPEKPTQQPPAPEASASLTPEARTTNYTSPFEELYKQTQSKPEDPTYQITYPTEVMTFNGSLGNIFTDLENNLSKVPTGSERGIMALHAARVIRAVIDWKIAHTDTNHTVADIELENYVANAIQLALSIYQQQPTALENLRNLRDRIMQHQPDLLTATVEQQPDYVTWSTSNPENSLQTAQKLKEDLDGRGVLFIALGHGGTAAGLDVYSRLQAMGFNKDSMFYVARLAMNKKGDHQPQLTHHEIAALIEYAQQNNLKILIFNEDSISGKSSNVAKTYFQQHALEHGYNQEGEDISGINNLYGGNEELHI